ncbi:GTPase Era [Litorimonas cladophorae]|uniref:GTPase Era n=1 Tax=Litorimonas cladophorae TaxID=1220491 RepID=A0A918KDA1_9PROT|nr:GTPase Era [Litorimonas cladophorae]GGX59260.1 GTPase Era [Litorimonas cladophorae]
MTRAGFAAIVGAPNAGKSTLTNALVGEKVSIVTHKVQTTRFQIRAIAMLETREGQEAQVVLVDTPGIFSPNESDRLAKSMVHAAWTGADDSNLIVHVVDAPAWLRQQDNAGSSQDRLSVDDTKNVAAGLKKRRANAYLVLNKIDEIAHDKVLPLIEEFNAMEVYSQIFMTSARNGEGVENLAFALADAMPESPLLYPTDQAADIPSRLMAAEITREKLFLRLHDELPYMSMVETEAWKELKGGDVRIEQVIYVRRSSQKPIVLGKGGKTIKDIGAAARRDMQDWLGRKVHLFLFVKVRDKWKDDQARYTGMGLEFDV